VGKTSLTLIRDGDQRKTIATLQCKVQGAPHQHGARLKVFIERCGERGDCNSPFSETSILPARQNLKHNVINVTGWGSHLP